MEIHQGNKYRKKVFHRTDTSLLSRARGIIETVDDLGSNEQQLDSEYAHIVPSDSSLVDRFEKRLKAKPLDFAPLRPKDMSKG